MSWIIVDKHFMNADLIFPTQQRDVSRIILVASADTNIRKVVIFGSSVTSACNPWSDIDVYFELDSDLNLPIFRLENSIDAWTNFSVGAELLQEIKKTGVVVYERDIA